MGIFTYNTKYDKIVCFFFCYNFAESKTAKTWYYCQIFKLASSKHDIIFKIYFLFELFIKCWNIFIFRFFVNRYLIDSFCHYIYFYLFIPWTNLYHTHFQHSVAHTQGAVFFFKFFSGWSKTAIVIII